MSSRQSRNRSILSERIDKRGIVAIVSCTRCARNQTPYRLSSLSKKCAECVRKGKKCQPAEPVVNFSGIDKAIEKLEREELETEAALDAATA